VTTCVVSPAPSPEDCRTTRKSMKAISIIMMSTGAYQCNYSAAHVSASSRIASLSLNALSSSDYPSRFIAKSGRPRVPTKN
jgi:hypothetical protein